MKPILAALLGGIIGSLLTGSLALASLARKKNLIEEQSREIARLKALPPPKPGKPWPESRSAVESSSAERWSRARVLAERRTKSLRPNSRALATKVIQLRDAAVRVQALEELRAELGSSDSDRRLAALLAYNECVAVDFDTSVFRPLITPLLASADPDERLAALQAFTSLPREPGDMAAITHLADDTSPMVRQQMFHSLRDLSNRGFTGAAAEALLKLINHPDAGGTRWGHLLSGQWAPELKQRLIEMASAANQDEQLTVSAVDALAAQQQKDEASVDCLIEKLSDPQLIGYGGQIFSGLRGGLPRELRAKVATAALQYIESTTEGYGRQQALYFLNFEGTAEHAEALTALAELPNSGTKLREELLKTAGEIRGRQERVAPAN